MEVPHPSSEGGERPVAPQPNLARVVADCLKQATAHHVAGNLERAEYLYRLILQKDPYQSEVWYFLGTVFAATSRPNEALNSFREAVRLDPDSSDTHNDLGNVLKGLDRGEEALASYRRAIELAPDAAVAHYNLGTLHFEDDEFEAAVEAFEKAVSLEPENITFSHSLAACLHNLGRFVESERLCRQILDIDESHARSHLCLSVSLVGLGRLAEAMRAFDRAYELEPDDLDVLFCLAQHLEGLGELSRASAAYLRILDLDPDAPAISRLFDIVLTMCDWRSYDGISELILERTRREIADRRPVTADIFNLLALPVTNQLIRAAARNKAGHTASRMARHKESCRFDFAEPRGAGVAVAGTREGRGGGKRIRLAYLLPYTTVHSAPLILKDIVERHDRTRFEVHGYTTRPCDGSPFSLAYRRSFDRFADVPVASPAISARRIHEDGIDLLVDITGHTATSCLDILALRPAPIQAHYLGYGMTTGADFVQYLITDRNFIPPEWRAYCSERLVYLPDTFMGTVRAPVAEEPVSRGDCGLPEEGFVFCNFNHPCKFEPRIFSSWMRLLEQLPGSVLWLGEWTESTRHNLGREAEARGVAAERLVFAPIVSPAAHLKRLPLADLALDNLYHGGGVTTVDALWSGLPVLTIAGQTPAGRLGVTLTHAAGVPELVCQSQEAYEERALALAREPEILAGLRRKLEAGRLTCPLFDNERYLRHLEAAYVEMWRIHQAGERPREIDVAALAVAHA